jgi:hypothetical protein
VNRPGSVAQEAAGPVRAASTPAQIEPAVSPVSGDVGPIGDIPPDLSSVSLARAAGRHVLRWYGRAHRPDVATGSIAATIAGTSNLVMGENAHDVAGGQAAPIRQIAIRPRVHDLVGHREGRTVANTARASHT